MYYNKYKSSSQKYYNIEIGVWSLKRYGYVCRLSSSECDGPSSDTDSDAESLTVSKSGRAERSNSSRSDSDQFSISESSSADH